MPRQSASALTIQRLAALIERPEVPADLVGVEREMCGQILDSKPADWFGPDSLPLLGEYVRAVVMSQRLAAKIEEALKSDDVDDWAKAERLMVMRDREAKRGMALAVKLRLTQQSRYTPQAAATAVKSVGGGGTRPWVHKPAA